MESILKFEGCEGELIWKENKLKIQFNLFLIENGDIKIDFGSQPLTKDNIWIEIAFVQKGVKAEVLNLEGVTPEGYFLQSDSVFLTKSGTTSNQNGSFVSAEATASQIDIILSSEPPPLVGEMQIEALVAGLQCFRQLKINHECGEIYVAGATKLDDYSKICGFVSLKRLIAENNEYEIWFEAAQNVLRRILDLLSFANGRFYQTNVLRIYHGGQLSKISIFRRISKTRPYKPPFSYLNLQPFIEVTVNQYTPELIRNTGLDVAIEWHLMSHAYNEDRYLGQMITIEHLLHVFREKRPSNRLLPKSKFKKIVRPTLEQKLDEILNSLCDNDSLEEKEAIGNIITELKAKIGNLNMQSLLSSLKCMLNDYRVPLDGLDEYIPRLITVRNDIVHRGIHESLQEQESLSDFVSAAEELIRRIFLSLFAYDGTYRTYFKEVSDCTFKRSAK